MPTRHEIYRILESILEEHVTDLQNVWVAVYRALLWYEGGIPHISEANTLRSGSWKQRAQEVEIELARALDCTPYQVESQLDVLMKHPSFIGMQRQNPLGIGFTSAVTWILRTFTQGYIFNEEAQVGVQVFRDVKNPPRRSIDLVALRDGIEYAILSTKWSLRHDRLRDLLDECTLYKTHKPGLKFFVVTNEFMPARLQRVSENFCVDKVFHINHYLARKVNGGNGRLEKIGDLSELPREFR